MSASELTSVAHDLLVDPNYRQRAAQASRQMRARRHPAEVAADAMERLLLQARSGEQQQPLRSRTAYHMNFVQFYMLDVLFGLYTLLLSFCLIICYCVLRGFRLFKRLIILRMDSNMKSKSE